MTIFTQNNRALVTEYLAWKYTVTYATSSADQKAATLVALNDGMRRYLTGEYKDDRGNTKVHAWRFLKEAAQITIATADVDYDLPDDYQGDVDGYVWDTDTLVRGRPLIELGYEEFLEKKRDYTVDGRPIWYTVHAKTYSAATATTYEWLCHPSPTADYNALTISYQYRIAIPDLLDSATAYPPGPLGTGDLIVQAAKMLNEQALGAIDGTETLRFFRKMNEMVTRDKQFIPGQRLQTRIQGGGRRWPRQRRAFRG